MNYKYKPKKEYGGYLPLELNPGKEMFEEYEKYLCRFNSVKASFAYIIKNEKPSRVIIPCYYCPSTTEALKVLDIDIMFYHISSDLEPEKVFDEKNTIIILVDYFGVKTKEIFKMVSKYKNATIIVDYAHSFFAKPIFQKNVYNVYSAKKFFGVPDGSYVVAENLSFHNEIMGSAYEYAGYLFKSYEEGVDSAYLEKKVADKVIAERYAGMSKLAIGLLKNVDYESVKIKRINNYRVLHRLLEDINELSIPQECPAYQYPLLISNQGKRIKMELVKKKIFVSTLWKGEDLTDRGNNFEHNMSNNAIFLPIDQRYNKDDMKFLAEKVLEIRENKFYE